MKKVLPLLGILACLGVVIYFSTGMSGTSLQSNSFGGNNSTTKSTQHRGTVTQQILQEQEIAQKKVRDMIQEKERICSRLSGTEELQCQKQIGVLHGRAKRMQILADQHKQTLTELGKPESSSNKGWQHEINLSDFDEDGIPNAQDSCPVTQDPNCKEDIIAKFGLDPDDIDNDGTQNTRDACPFNKDPNCIGNVVATDKIKSHITFIKIQTVYAGSVLDFLDKLQDWINQNFGTCDDGMKNGDEEDVDCGGSCPRSCPETCSDGKKNRDEEGVDCGGRYCAPCAPTCTDGKKNGDEEGIDCGGPVCTPCSSCQDGVQNGDEEGVDCGGPYCPACATCQDRVQNGDEEGIDCGGSCARPCENTCDDGVKNWDEEGVDCGGLYCQECKEEMHPTSEIICEYPAADNYNGEGICILSYCGAQKRDASSASTEEEEYAKYRSWLQDQGSHYTPPIDIEGTIVSCIDFPHLPGCCDYNEQATCRVPNAKNYGGRLPCISKNSLTHGPKIPIPNQ